MSAAPQAQSTNNGNNNADATERSGVRLLRILIIFFGFAALVGVPLLGYFIGQFLGTHMAASDIDQGYAYSGLLYVVYNATGNPIYHQASQIALQLGITTGQSDVNTLSLILLVGGLLVDVPIAYYIIRTYEELD